MLCMFFFSFKLDFLFLPTQLSVCLCCVFWALIALSLHNLTSIPLRCSLPFRYIPAPDTQVWRWCSDYQKLEFSWTCSYESSENTARDHSPAQRRSVMGKIYWGVGRGGKKHHIGKKMPPRLELLICIVDLLWSVLTLCIHIRERYGSVDGVSECVVRRDSWPQCYTLSNTAKINSSQ